MNESAMCDVEDPKRSFSISLFGHLFSMAHTDAVVMPRLVPTGAE